MSVTSGFLHLNVANEWPSFDLHEIEIAPDGALQLAASKKRGVALAGPFDTFEESTEWFRLRVESLALPAHTHLQLFTYTADSGAPSFAPFADLPFDFPGWQAGPRDLEDILIPNSAARLLWIGLMLRGPGDSTPRLGQIRVDYGRRTYLSHLPAIYSNPGGGFFERLLALTETAIGGIEREIDDLPLHVDPAAVPFPEWLDWLNGWLAWERSERWSEAESREYLSQVFELYGWRGTIEGLKRYLKIYAGVTAHIEEPGRLATLWSLGDVSGLGITTRLAPSPLQGAVIGSTATVDASQLAVADDGASLFEDVAHRFCVQVYCSDLKYPQALETVRAVIDREKPAHTTYDLCVIDAQMRVGWQARIGIDAIIARGAPRAQLGRRLGGTTLAAQATPCDKTGNEISGEEEN